MATEPELHRVRHDPDEVRSIANFLLNAYGPSFNPWEAEFLNDMKSSKRSEPLSYRQAEKLLQIRDSYHAKTHHRGLKLRLLVEACYQARDDLSEGSAEFIEYLHEQRTDAVRSRDISALLRCAYRLGEIEEHMLIRPDAPRDWDEPRVDPPAKPQPQKRRPAKPPSSSMGM